MSRITLSEGQRNAVRHARGPACVIAGVGTGKTTALIERVVFLVRNQRLAPERILVTTFTRKVTSELYGRLQSRLGNQAQRICVSTIDTVALDVAERLTRQGLLPQRALIGEAEQTVLLIYSARDTKPERIHFLKRCVQDGEVSAKHYNRWRIDQRFEPPSRSYFEESLRRYFHELEKRRLQDYASLTRRVLDCIRTMKCSTDKFWDAVIVDEFQDTSRNQAELLLLLSGRRRNIWIVGDPCQQIYEWRGASPGTFDWFLRSTGAKRYRLTNNHRSTQTILDGSYNFLKRAVPQLQRRGFLRRLTSMREERTQAITRHPIYRASLRRAFRLLGKILHASPDLRPGSIAILSRKLTRGETQRIEKIANDQGFKIQVHSTRPAHALEKTLEITETDLYRVCGQWGVGHTLTGLYALPSVKRIFTRALESRDFAAFRELRAISHVADAVDRATPSRGGTYRYSFPELFPALRNVQERDISVSTAVAAKSDCVQVMTIHAAKGLEFPTVAVMTIGKSFPKEKNYEDARLLYVGTTRARDCLILIPTCDQTPEQSRTLAAFESSTVTLAERIGNGRIEYKRNSNAPLVAATHLDFYEQCPLKFAAFHEGRFLPKWTLALSFGRRMHRALECYLRGEDPRRIKETFVEDCFRKALEEGDPLRPHLPRNSVQLLHRTLHGLVRLISREYRKMLAVEERYRYVHASTGQVEGVIDAVLERSDGGRDLIEWKTAPEISPTRRRAYELQARVGAIGLMSAHPDLKLTHVEVVPVFKPADRLRLAYDKAFVEKTTEALDALFTDLHKRNYEPTPGAHCKECPLRSYCPAKAA